MSLITFTHPQDNEDVPGFGSFEAYGQIESGYTADSAHVTHGGGQVNGYPLSPPTGYDWSFGFEDVPTNEWVTLTVVYSSSLARADQPADPAVPMMSSSSESITIRCTEE